MLDNLRASIRRTAFALLGLLALLFLYLSYIQVIESDYLAGHPLNRRTAAAAEKVERGTIYDRRGEKLAYSEKDGDGRYVRRYPYGAVAAHVVGYSSPRYGQSGVESAMNGELSGMTNPERRFGPITGLWTAKAGNSVTLTIDGELQETAYRALGNRRGAVVAIAPRSGAVLAMVSRPAFEPEAVDEEWKEIVGAAGSPLLNRAVQGLYPPGSTIKVLVAEAALTEKITDNRKTYDCEGSLTIGPITSLTKRTIRPTARWIWKRRWRCPATSLSAACRWSWAAAGWRRLSSVSPSRVPSAGILPRLPAACRISAGWGTAISPRRASARAACW